MSAIRWRHHAQAAPVADPRIETGVAGCKKFSHDPMSGDRGAKGLVWYIFSYAKGENWRKGAMAP